MERRLICICVLLLQIKNRVVTLEAVGILIVPCVYYSMASPKLVVINVYLFKWRPFMKKPLSRDNFFGLFKLRCHWYSPRFLTGPTGSIEIQLQTNVLLGGTFELLIFRILYTVGIWILNAWNLDSPEYWTFRVQYLDAFSMADAKTTRSYFLDSTFLINLK